MLNARAYATGKSAFHLSGYTSFLAISGGIFLGQILLINLVPEFFSVAPISLSDWLNIILATSSVLWIGEIFRLKKRKTV